MNKLLQMAETMANRSYCVDIEEETLPNGELVYVVETPELDGCMAQASSIEEALERLLDARVEYIHALLEDGLLVPFPGGECNG